MTMAVDTPRRTDLSLPDALPQAEEHAPRPATNVWPLVFGLIAATAMFWGGLVAWAAVTPIAVAGIAVAVDSAAIDVERAVVLAAALADELVDRRAFERGAARVGTGLLAWPGRFVATDIEQGIGLERLADESLDFEVRQRQQLDRLLQLRRHYQRLRLPQV